MARLSTYLLAHQACRQSRISPHTNAGTPPYPGDADPYVHKMLASHSKSESDNFS